MRLLPSRLLLGLASGLALASCTGRPAAPSAKGPRVQDSSPASTSFPTPPTSAPTTTLLSARSADGPVASWLTSERSFYRAGQLGRPDFGPLVASFAPGSPALKGVVSFLTSLQSAGVVAPREYKVGNGALVHQSAGRAEVTGCSFDSGSTYRGSGAPAPAALGGGAGLTAYRVLLLRRSGRWLVWSASPSAVSSPNEPGPCHGF